MHLEHECAQICSSFACLLRDSDVQINAMTIRNIQNYTYLIVLALLISVYLQYVWNIVRVWLMLLCCQANLGCQCYIIQTWSKYQTWYFVGHLGSTFSLMFGHAMSDKRDNCKKKTYKDSAECWKTIDFFEISMTSFVIIHIA